MKKNVWPTFYSKSVEKVNFFQKLGLALGLGLGLGLAIQVVKMATFDGPDGVQGWESDEKRIFGESFGPKVWKSGLFQKLVLALGLKEKFGLFVDFEFLTEMGSWHTD